MQCFYEVKNPKLVSVEWYDNSGKYHLDYFSTRAGLPAPAYAEMSNWEVWENPYDGVRKFLSHIPLHNVRVEVEA